MKLPRKDALKIAKFASNGDTQSIIDFFKDFPTEKKGSWGHTFQKLLPFLLDSSSPAPFKIFTKGNSKLPFFSFSNLPLVNCPGKGPCAKWCYSMKAWQYPSAFFRQVQNTLLIRQYSNQLTTAFLNLAKNTDVRLYVDGDFDSLQTMKFWFNLMFQRSDLKVYGYSKSWEIFLQYDKEGLQFPTNYTLNLSSGSKYENFGNIRASMKLLPVVRGEFIAIDAGKKPAAKSIREIAKSFGMKKIFVCPGRCGECLNIKNKNVHACGSTKMKNVNILIGTH